MMSRLNDDVLLAGSAAVLLYIVILLSGTSYEVADKTSVSLPVETLYVATVLYLVVYVGISILQEAADLGLTNLKKREVSKTTASIILGVYLAVGASFLLSLFAYSMQPAGLAIDALEGNISDYARAALFSWHVSAVAALTIIFTKMIARKNPLLFLSVNEDAPESETGHKEADTA